MRTKFLISSIVVCAFLSCTRTVKHDPGAAAAAPPSGSEVAADDENAPGCLLKFREFDLYIDTLDVWDEEGELENVQTDSADVYVEVGETIEGRTIRIDPHQEGAFQVYQRYENSMTVMNEGPHCDLTEWKHYYSDWKKLPVTNGRFVTDTYSKGEWEKFVEVDLNELQEAVRVHCGDAWADSVKNVKSPNDYPCGVGNSRIFLKIGFLEKGKQRPVVKIVSFYIPMGC